MSIDFKGCNNLTLNVGSPGDSPRRLDMTADKWEAAVHRAIEAAVGTLREAGVWLELSGYIDDGMGYCRTAATSVIIARENWG